MKRTGTNWRRVLLTPDTMEILEAFCEYSGLSPRDALSLMVREVARDQGLIPGSSVRGSRPRTQKQSARPQEPTRPRKPRRKGQIIQKGPAKWLVRVYVGRDPEGKRRYVSRTIKGDRKQAERALDLGLARAVERKARERSRLWREIWET